MKSKTIQKGHPSHKVIKGLLANYCMLVVTRCELGIDDLFPGQLYIEMHIYLAIALPQNAVFIFVCYILFYISAVIRQC